MRLPISPPDSSLKSSQTSKHRSISFLSHLGVVISPVEHSWKIFYLKWWHYNLRKLFILLTKRITSITENVSNRRKTPVIYSVYSMHQVVYKNLILFTSISSFFFFLKKTQILFCWDNFQTRVRGHNHKTTLAILRRHRTDTCDIWFFAVATVCF